MKRTCLIFIISFVFAACGSKQKKNKAETSQDTATTITTKTTTNPGATEKASISAPMMTIEKLSDDFTGDSAWLDIGDNKRIVVYASFEEVESEKDLGPKCPTVDDNLKCKSDIFQGCFRGVAKTTMLSGQPTSYETIKQLLANLTPDTDMDARSITRSEDSKREPEEKRNVLIRKAYMYQIYREPDNDYHMIIGDSPRFSEARFFNVEISGVPRGASEDITKKFMKIRNKIKNHPKIGDLGCGTTRDIRANPLLITNLSGSLYFDSPHDAGSVGRNGIKAASAWEIHPVKDLTLAGFQ